MMLDTTAFGVMKISGGVDFLQTITASKIGSLLTTGIGPIVLASIFLQLFVGAGILNLDLKDKAQRAKFLHRVSFERHLPILPNYEPRLLCRA
jgi:preprotein translocase subunit SecY